MRRFELVRSDTDCIVSHSGLALVGRAFGHTRLDRDCAPLSLRHGIAHVDCLKSYVGLLCTGKSDFEAVESRRGDTFFKTALGIRQVPSAPRLRQRFDKRADEMAPIVDAASGPFNAIHMNRYLSGRSMSRTLSHSAREILSSPLARRMLRAKLRALAKMPGFFLMRLASSSIATSRT